MPISPFGLTEKMENLKRFQDPTFRCRVIGKWKDMGHIEERLGNSVAGVQPCSQVQHDVFTNIGRWSWCGQISLQIPANLVYSKDGPSIFGCAPWILSLLQPFSFLITAWMPQGVSRCKTWVIGRGKEAGNPVGAGLGLAPEFERVRQDHPWYWQILIDQVESHQ